MKHILKRKYEGENEMGNITPTCSCGWIGRPEFAYNDYQYSNVNEQESEHLRKSNLAQSNDRGVIKPT